MPPLKKRPVREKDIEDPSVQYARDHGAVVRKMNGLGYRSWPDRLFHLLNAHSFYVEFKKPGEKPTDAQARIHKDLRAVGQEVYVIDDYWAFTRLFDRIHSRPKRRQIK